MTPQDKLNMFDECRAALEAGKELQIKRGEHCGYSSGYDLMFYQYKGRPRPMEHGEWDLIIIHWQRMPTEY